MVKWFGLLLLLCGLLATVRPVAAGGTWSAVNQYAPDQVFLMLLLSDGQILCENNPEGFTGSTIGNNWFLLTPDGQGSYANGSWSTAASAHYSRQFFASQVLPNGDVWVAGGEYGSGSNSAEIYNPLQDNWTVCPNTPQGGSNGILDAISEMLPNGNVLLAPVNPYYFGETLIWDTAANNWSTGPSVVGVEDQSEVSWVLLADGSILSYGPLGRSGNGTNAQRYIPSLNQWLPDANVPVQLWADLSSVDLVGETGPGFLLPNGKAFFLGGSGHTAIYTPSPLGGTNMGSWVQGPDIPNGLVSTDAPGCMLITGNILCCVGNPVGTNGGTANFPNGLSFYEYDYRDGPIGSFTQVGSPPESGDFPTYCTVMLAMPDGTVLYSQVEQNTFDADAETTLYIYTPDGGGVSSGQPTIQSITMNQDGSYHLVGTGLNGISQGAAFGDDAQMNSNYPLVRNTDANGNVYYAYTYNWSSTGVQTGSAIVTTEFLCLNLPPGNYSVQVVANGFASDPQTFNAPVWVDFNYGGSQNGTYANPWETLAQGIRAVASGGTIAIEANVQPSVSSGTTTISKPMTITSVNGPSTIGN